MQSEGAIRERINYLKAIAKDAMSDAERFRTGPEENAERLSKAMDKVTRANAAITELGWAIGKPGLRWQWWPQD